MSAKTPLRFWETGVVETTGIPFRKGTFMVKNSKRRPRVKMTGGSAGLVNHAGARLLTDLAGRLGLTAGLSAAMAPTKQRRRGHDRGDVMVDLAVAIADGATTISDLAVLRAPRLADTRGPPERIRGSM